MKSIKKNYIYNLIYQIFLLIIPFVVTPYVSRVLTPTGVGQYSFSYTIINYFIVLAGLGFNLYSQREMAKCRDNKVEITIQFWNTFICKISTSIVSFLICVLISFFNVFESYQIFIIILSIEIISTMFDIIYLYQANEDFGVIVIRNIIIKTISIITIFIFVKDINDLWIYCFINAMSILLSNISLWIGLSKYLTKVNIKMLNPLKQLKGSILLFIPTMATTIYLLLNRTFIGFLVPGSENIIQDGVTIVSSVADIQNGFYDSADKVVKMVVTVITSIGTVMISRNSYEIKHGNIEIVKSNFYKVSKFVWFLGIPMLLGVISIAYNFVPWFFGEGYNDVSRLIILESFLIIIIGFSNVYGYLYLMPAGYEKKLGINSLIAVIIDLLLCLILIPNLYAFGAMIANVITELWITIGMIIMARKTISFKSVLKTSWKYFIAGIIMFSCTLPLGIFLKSSFLNTFIIIFSGCIIYMACLIIFRDDMLKYLLDLFRNFIKNKISKK